MKLILTESERFNFLILEKSGRLPMGVTDMITVNENFCRRFFMTGSTSFEDESIVDKPTVDAAIEWIEGVLENDKKHKTFTNKWELKAKEQAEKKVLPFLKKNDHALFVRIFS